MTSFRRIATPVTFLLVVGGAVILGLVYKEKAVQRKLAASVRARAEQGDLKAQYDLAFMYYEGRGVAQNYAEAVRWCRESAERGYAMAQASLASMYYQGTGVPQDHSEAVAWYRKAAEHGDAKAQYGLGVSYAYGHGVRRDPAEAVRWYRSAAEQGHAAAQYGLGEMYRKGEGAPQNYGEAVRWFRQAAERGDAAAQYGLGFMYHKGQGVPQDETEALRWYRKAADQGNAHAKHALSRMYRQKGPKAPLGGWASIAVVLLVLLMLAGPQRRWGGPPWLAWALASALGVTTLIHELLLSELSVAVLAHGPLGIFWSGMGRVVMLAVLAGSSAVCGIRAAVEAARGWKRR